MGKMEKISAWNLTKVRSKKEVIDEARTKGAKVHFASLMDICHSKNAELETKHEKIQRSSCTPRWYWERRFWSLCSTHWIRIVSVPNDSGKSHGYHFQTTRLRRTSSWRNICLYTQTIGFVYHDTHGQNHGLQYGRSSRSSWAKSVRSSFGRTMMGKAIWEILLQHGWEEGFQLGMLIWNQWKRIILVSVCGRHQIGWKETKYWSDVWKYSIKKLIWENQHLSLIMCIWDVLNDNERYCGQLQSHVWITNFRG